MKGIEKQKYTVGWFKVEIVFWIFLISLTSYIIGVNYIFNQVAEKINVEKIFEIPYYFIWLITFFGAGRLMFATTNYFNIEEKNKQIKMEIKKDNFEFVYYVIDKKGNINWFENEIEAYNKVLENGNYFESPMIDKIQIPINSDIVKKAKKNIKPQF